MNKAVVESNGVKICAFDIGYVCELNLEGKTFKQPFERAEAVTDKTKIFECGIGIPSRGVEPVDPELKAKCNGLLTELPVDK